MSTLALERRGLRRRWARVRGQVTLALALLVMGGTAACDDADPIGPEVVDLELVEGLYGVLTITFDPQGSAPAADVLAALSEAGRLPTLNIGKTGNFQLFFRDPATGDITTLSGDVEATEEGIDLVFPSQADADAFVFPRRLPLEFTETTQTLSFSGAVEVSRTRLQQLFPELYADEQLFDPTPGILTVGFQKGEGTG